MHFPLRVIRSVLDYFLNLLVGKVHVLVLALNVGSCPVEQFPIVIAFQVLAAKTIECALDMFSFRFTRRMMSPIEARRTLSGYALAL